MKKIKTINDIEAQGISGNMGTARGSEALEQSVKNFGLGRGICVDKNGVVIAGEKLLEAAKKAGVTKIRVVRTRGERIVAVKRKDLKLESDQAAKELAVMDNRAAELNLFWDQSMIEAVAGLGFDLKDLGFDKLIGMGNDADTWTAGIKEKSAATLNIGGIYVIKVSHQAYTDWNARMVNEQGYQEDAILEEIKKRLGF